MPKEQQEYLALLRAKRATRRAERGGGRPVSAGGDKGGAPPAEGKPGAEGGAAGGGGGPLSYGEREELATTGLLPEAGPHEDKCAPAI